MTVLSVLYCSTLFTKALCEKLLLCGFLPCTVLMIELWISTGCGHDVLIKMSERGDGIGNSWLDLIKSVVSRTLKMAKKVKL